MFIPTCPILQAYAPLPDHHNLSNSSKTTYIVLFSYPKCQLISMA
jgi:hypothetical protein